LFAVISAAAASVIPTIAVTGRAISQSIGRAHRVRFGRLTGALLVADIAVSVAAVGMAFAVFGQAVDPRAADRATGIAASEYLAVEVRLPEGEASPLALGGTDPVRVRFAADQRELVAALEREPGVLRVAVGDALPRMEHASRPYEMEGDDRAPGASLRWIRQARVDVDFMDAIGARIHRGRDFVRADVEGGAPVAIVNTAFVAQVLGGRDPIGKRVRFPVRTGTDGAPWHEIVGVVGPLGVNVLNAERGEAVYLPAAPGTLNPMQLAVHSTLPPTSLTGRVREVATAVDPDLVVGRMSALSEVRQGDWYLVMGLVTGLLVLVGVLVALATSGLFAMLSLSVTERTREIGIRVALGAPRHAVLSTIMRRSLLHVGLGVLIGLPLASRFVFELLDDTGGASVVRAVTVAVGLALGIVTLVGLGAWAVPARRILSIEASEAMRSDG
jgi:hypothetical protein